MDPRVDRSLDPTSPDFVARVGRQLGWNEHKLPARPIDSDHVRRLVGPSFQVTVGDALGVVASVEGDVTMGELEAAALALAPLDTGCRLWQAKLREDGRYGVSFSVSIGSPFPGVRPGGPHRSWPREPSGSLELSSFETCACGAVHVVLAPGRSQSRQERRTTSFPCLGCGRWILHDHSIPEGRGCEVHLLDRVPLRHAPHVYECARECVDGPLPRALRMRALAPWVGLALGLVGGCVLVFAIRGCAS